MKSFAAALYGVETHTGLKVAYSFPFSPPKFGSEELVLLVGSFKLRSCDSFLPHSQPRRA